MEKQEAINKFLEHIKANWDVIEDFDFREVKGGWIVVLKNDFKHWDKIPVAITAYSINEKTGKVKSYGVSMRKEGSNTSKLAEDDLAKGI
jgi:hypothetical protein